MINIKRWLSQRDQSLAKTEPVERPSLGDFMQTLETELGPQSRIEFGKLVAKHVPFSMAKQYYPKESGLTFLIKYLTVPGYRKECLDEQPSNFHRQLLEKSVYEFGHWASTALQNLTLSDVTPEDLSKSVAQKDWKKVAKAHEPESELTVESQPHITQFPVHPEHSKDAEVWLGVRRP